MAGQRHLQPGRGLLRAAGRDGSHFVADSQAELLEQITSFEPRPPRQMDDRIPKELERICLKALAKRASERYTTAKDMADDLRHFLAEPGQHQLADQAATSGRRSRPRRHAAGRQCSVDSPGAGWHVLDATLAVNRSRSCRKACGPSTPRMPTSSSNCCRDRVTGKVCRTAFASGRPASRRRTPTIPSPWA